MKLTSTPDSLPRAENILKEAEAHYPSLAVAAQVLERAPQLRRAISQALDGMVVAPDTKKSCRAALGLDVKAARAIGLLELLSSHADALLDVSCDGRRALLKANGGFVIRDLVEGTSHNIPNAPGFSSRDPAVAHQPAFSGDGLTVVSNPYVHDGRRLYEWDAISGEGRERRIAFEFGRGGRELKAISNDGRYITVRGYNSFGIARTITADRDTGNVTTHDGDRSAAVTNSGRIATCSGGAVALTDWKKQWGGLSSPGSSRALSFSPDERVLLVVKEQETHAWAIDWEKGETSFLWSAGAVGPLCWSRDGRWVGLGGNLLNAETGDVVAQGAATTAPTRIVQEGHAVHLVAMSWVRSLTSERNPTPAKVIATFRPGSARLGTADLSRDEATMTALSAYQARGNSAASLSGRLVGLITSRAAMSGAWAATDIVSRLLAMDAAKTTPPEGTAAIETLSPDSANFLDNNGRGDVTQLLSAVPEGSFMGPEALARLGLSPAQARYYYLQQVIANRANRAMLATSAGTMAETLNAAAARLVWPQPEPGSLAGFVNVNPTLPYPSTFEAELLSSGHHLSTLQNLGAGKWTYGEPLTLIDFSTLPTRHLKRLLVRVGVGSKSVSKTRPEGMDDVPHPLVQIRGELHDELRRRREGTAAVRELYDNPSKLNSLGELGELAQLARAHAKP